MEFVDRFRAKTTKASQAQSKLKQIDRMEKIEAPGGEDRKVSFSFPQPQRSGLKVITLKNIHHAYGENVVYQRHGFRRRARPAHRARRAERRGQIHAAENSRRRACSRRPARASWAITSRPATTRSIAWRCSTPAHTVLEEALDTPQRVTEQFVRTLLGCFLFVGDDVFKPVSVLSGGEKSRLALVKLLLDPPNLLLMDEPTTHLDMSSIDALLYALDQFEGTLIFISHDVYFIRALANHVVHINAGRLTHYPGDYQYYLDKTKAQSARAALTATGGDAAPAVGAAGRPASPLRARNRSALKPKNARPGRACARNSNRSCTGWKRKFTNWNSGRAS